jgi:tRNA-2-methylthio-N6-dimethylallyladenosine synthase
VGFPGETDRDFEDTMTLVRDMGFDTSFTFIFSPRPGTPAANLPDDTPMAVKKERLKQLQTCIANHAMQYSEAMIGTTQRVLVTGPSKKDAAQWASRTECNRVVNFEGPADLLGQFVNIHITEAHPNSLRGYILESQPA